MSKVWIYDALSYLTLSIHSFLRNGLPHITGRNTLHLQTAGCQQWGCRGRCCCEPSVSSSLAAEYLRFVLFLGEAGGCQCCRPLGSAGCHLRSVQETITDSCQAPPPSSRHRSYHLTLTWHQPWCQLGDAASIKNHTTVIAPKLHSESMRTVFYFFPLTTTEYILGGTRQRINTEKLQIQVRRKRQQFFHVSSDKEASVLQGWGVTCGGKLFSAVTFCQPSSITPHRVVSSPAVMVVAGGEAGAGGWWLYHSRKWPEGGGDCWSLDSKGTGQSSSQFIGWYST